ncbi:DivIVA domain-containing protein [Streptomyces anulatus]|uniref:DivIVA domain-containing protein n=1 Tax=Streptomyces TaxID=1883 RepID=UPI000BEFBE6B|nr:DivIVA domain-containing protein [Streptomyces sp. or20]WSV77379.1 DivIVA domain-containing protein [Streptomyces anulatus]
MARSEPDEVSAPGEMRVFWFLLLTMVVVVTAVTLAVVGGGGSAVLQDVPPDRFTDPLPATRPVGRADIEALRLPMAPRGYRMADVDEALSRLGAELAERDARIAELESALAGVQAAAVTTGTDLFKQPGDRQGDRPAEPIGQDSVQDRTEEDGR